MTQHEYEQQIQEQQKQIQLLQKNNLDLLNRNMRLSQQIDA